MIYMIGTRLYQIRMDAGLSQPEFAAIADTTKQYVSQIESGRNQTPGPEYIEKWCQHFGLRTRWVLTGTGPKYAKDSEDDPEWSAILGVRQAAALGDGAEPDEYAETHKLKFRSASLARKKLKPDRLAVIYGKGDSMYPTIKDGDAILVDLSDKEPKDDCVFVVTMGRDLMAKRLIKLGNQWFIDSDNKSDPKWKKPVAIDEAKGFEIHGRVRWIGSWVD